MSGKVRHLRPLPTFGPANAPEGEDGERPGRSNAALGAAARRPQPESEAKPEATKPEAIAATEGPVAAPGDAITPSSDSEQPSYTAAGVTRLVPQASGDSTARVLDPQPEKEIEISDIPGITPPQSRAHSGFVTDAITQLGFLSPDLVDNYVAQSRTAGRSPEQLMLESGAIDSDKLSRAVAERYGLDHVDLAVYSVDMGAVNTVPASAVKRYRAVPVGYIDSSTLLLAVTDPTNVLAVDDLKMMTGLDCVVAVASPDDIEGLLGRLNSLDSTVTDAVAQGQDEDEDESDAEQAADELQSSFEDAPVIKLVFGILGQAVQQGASDIHFEVKEGDMRVRFRVDGVLHEAATIPRRMMNGVVSRLKIMADLDIAEKRIPQDGRISVNIDDQPVDMRITTLPTQRGEGGTIRILDKEQAMLSLDELGMHGDPRERFEDSFKRPYGCVIVTGPTGSGKSTTLYSALNELNQIEKKIITIEDPVEFRVEGINQINVNVKAGLTFAAGLRSVLRADPDVVMVGEIRDPETARIAIEAALTGHMVLSTLHTNTAPGAIARLTKMGVESFLISSAVECVIAQRLGRKLCTHCKKRTMIPQSALAEAGIRVGADLEAYEPDGCARCGRSGYSGRIGLYSVMRLTDNLKEMITAAETEASIERAAREEGMLTLREAGLEKIRAGVTSLEEIARVTV